MSSKGFVWQVHKSSPKITIYNLFTIGGHWPNLMIPKMVTCDVLITLVL